MSVHGKCDPPVSLDGQQATRKLAQPSNKVNRYIPATAKPESPEDPESPVDQESLVDQESPVDQKSPVDQ